MAIKQLAKAATSMGMSQRASARVPFCYALELHPDGLLSIFYWPIVSSTGGFFMPKTRQSCNNRWGWRFLPSPLKVTEPAKEKACLVWIETSFFVGSLFRYSFIGSSSVYNIIESDAILNDVVGIVFSNTSAAFFICGDALEGIQAKILPVSANPTYSVKIVSGG